LEPSDTTAIFFPVAGFITSKVFDGLVHAPPMKWPNFASCLASHSWAGLSPSGAGPYAMVS